MRIEELVDQYGDDILRLCLLYMGDRQWAEDAFQETMVKAWRALPRFKGESSIKTWLSRIAVNTCRDMLRSGFMRMYKKSQPLETLLELSAPGEGDAAAVTQAVVSLPGKYREIIVLSAYKGMKIREIAQVLGLSENTVSTRLRRARARIAASLKEGEA